MPGFEEFDEEAKLETMTHAPDEPHCGGTDSTDDRDDDSAAPDETLSFAAGSASTDEHPSSGGLFRPRGPAGTLERIGPYEIVRPLGEGGFGAVYLARQETPVRRDVALKLLKPGTDSPDTIARFESERQALALLNHDGVAKVFDAGRTPDGRSYFVMEYVDGQPVHRVCDQKRLDLRERLQLFLAICSAVQHAHFKGIIHRDLKPSNILVADQEGELRPKVIDLGLAKATRERLSEQSVHSLIGLPMGTPEYMSPEQALGSADGVDVRTDVYSLGVVLYQLFCGALPFESTQLRGNLMEMQRVIAEVDPPRPSARFAALPGEEREAVAASRRITADTLDRRLAGDLDWIAMKAIEKEAERRYSSVGELMADIERYLGDEMVLARAPTTVYRVQKFVRRNRGFVAASGIILVLLVVGLVTSTGFWWEAETNRIGLQQRLDGYLLENYIVEADTLWPLAPELEPELIDWISRVEDLLSRLPEHREALEETSDDEVREFLKPVVEKLTAFERASAEHSILADIRGRLKLLRELMAHDMDPRMQSRWQEAITAIADVGICPLYRGLRIEPQFGLVPLGRDPESTLYEFWHVQTGAEPSQNEDDHVVMTELSGVVLVLIPGGRFHMGSQVPEEGQVGPNMDPQSTAIEQPVEEVALHPYFLAKFEMTQAQWLRFTGQNPSRRSPALNLRGVPYPLTNPVEQVEWELADDVVSKLGLSLPTEAQWERAARAGTTTPWYVGDTKEPLVGHVNIADKSLIDYGSGSKSAREWPDHDDGHPTLAPVGRFLPNPYGLHDIHGNVWEWCADEFDRYDPEGCPPRPGDGLRVRPPGRRDRTARGGSWRNAVSECRASSRLDWIAPSDDIGIRPARKLVGYAPAD